MPNSFEADVIDRLARIEQKVADKDVYCKLHSARLDALESTQGKQNLVAATIGAIGAGLVLLVKYVVMRSH